ncbi:hypothetical protein DFJ58DRAFT_157394 [Suillus subalutaceus]|uniref:uncharacterized protein n=1 Tax=Suillus subalutaceus TaxID=48586 RepID=UPI001B872163|nr:uncharacterized protein DFJ58DRAFT_157394 [Suillus subalutaceus]KAG1836967.1 hypothetical protein DFJ58DRAFT_157394 [Suillus subalutaceus]
MERDGLRLSSQTSNHQHQPRVCCVPTSTFSDYINIIDGSIMIIKLGQMVTMCSHETWAFYFSSQYLQMEYSVDDIATARNLQFLVYIYISTATFWTYDFVCSLQEEWTFLLRSRWTKVKGIYVIARYVPFVIIILDLCLTLGQNKNPKECQILSNISAFFAVISITFSECFFILRIYALWNNNRIVLVTMLSALFPSYHLSALCLSLVLPLMSRPA